jgi:ketosteroid isomerase-like protein
MFCHNCGSRIDDKASSCPVCGTPIATKTSPAPTAPATPRQSKLSNSTIGIIAVVGALIVALIIGIIFLLPGSDTGSSSGSESQRRTYKDVVKDYFKAMETADAKLMMELLPEDMIKSIMKDEDMTKKEMTDELQYMLDYMFISADQVKITYVLTDTEEVDEYDLDDLKEEYKDEYDIKVKDAMIVEVEVTVKVDGEKTTDDIELCLIKVGSSWYLAGFEGML